MSVVNQTMAEAGGIFSDDSWCGADDSGELCRYFNTEAGCRYGDCCHYKHVKGKKPECWFYRLQGWCAYGDKCYFDHSSCQEKLLVTGESSCKKSNGIGDEADSVEGGNARVAKQNDPIKATGAKNTKDEDLEKLKEGIAALQIVTPGCDGNNNEPAKLEDGKADQMKTNGASIDSKSDPGAKAKIVKCSECNAMFFEKSDQLAKEALAEHYQLKFSKTDRRHLRIFRENRDSFDIVYLCTFCDRVLDNINGFLQHTTGKATSQKAEGKSHKEFMDRMTALFAERDMGTIEEKVMLIDLIDMLETDYAFMDSDSDEDFHVPYFARTVFRMMSKGADDPEWLERSENFGFTEDEVNELLCQGIKPWDPEASAALDILYN